MSQIGDLDMKVTYAKSVEKKVLDRVKTLKGNIILRKDLKNVGTYRQISRVINKLIKSNKIVRLSLGVYARAYTSKFTNIPLIKGGVDSTLRKVLDRLDVEYEPSSVEKAYNAGKTTQVPGKNIVRLKKRCRRKIGYGKNQLVFENNTNAK